MEGQKSYEIDNSTGCRVYDDVPIKLTRGSSRDAKTTKNICPEYDVKLHSAVLHLLSSKVAKVLKAQFSTIDVLVGMLQIWLGSFIIIRGIWGILGVMI